MSDRMTEMSMHRMKSMAIKAREEMIDERRRDESASSRFSRAVKTGAEYAAGDAAHAGRSAAERAYRKYGKKKIRDRQQRAKFAEREVMRNEAELRGSRVRFTSAVADGGTSAMAGAIGPSIDGAATFAGEIRITEPPRIANNNNMKNVSREGVAKNLQKAPQSATLNMKYLSKQRDYSIRKLQRKSMAGENRRFFSNIGGFRRAGSNAAGSASKAAKRAASATRTVISAIAAAGSSAIVIILICIFLSASVYLFGQDTNDDFSAEALGTGDTLITRVASAQLGNVGGLKFCRWYGFNGRVEWCAVFVSWCANQCGYIDKGIIPKFAVVGDGIDWFKARNQFRNNKYIPHPGDIIFFDWDADGTRDHVGLVERCDGKMVYTIEGNSGDVCRRLAYRVGHPEVIGYGIPAYPMPQSSPKSKNTTDNDAYKES